MMTDFFNQFIYLDMPKVTHFIPYMSISSNIIVKRAIWIIVYQYGTIGKI